MAGIIYLQSCIKVGSLAYLTLSQLHRLLSVEYDYYYYYYYYYY
jgi:hypothetical protein